jgi:hypothetical protein
MLDILDIAENDYFPAIFARVSVECRKIFLVIQTLRQGKRIFIAHNFFFFRGGKIMSPISGIDSSSLLNALSNSLNNSAKPNSPSDTEPAGTDTQQATSASAATSLSSLLEQMELSFLQNQYSFMTSLFSSDDSSSPDSLASVLGNAETDNINGIEASNPQLTQLFNTLNSSSLSSASNDPTETLLQSFDGSGLSQSNSNSLQTTIEDLLNSSGSTANSSAQGILDQYLSLSPSKSSLIKTTV